MHFLECLSSMFRSPEIILGLPFSEATDMWSLGVVLGLMICGCQLFPGHESYEVVSHLRRRFRLGLVVCAVCSALFCQFTSVLLCRGSLTRWTFHLNVDTRQRGGKKCLNCCVVFPKQLMFIVIRLGQPADQYLENGRRTRVYFFKTGSNSWKIKVPPWNFFGFFHSVSSDLCLMNVFTPPQM